MLKFFRSNVIGVSVLIILFSLFFVLGPNFAMAISLDNPLGNNVGDIPTLIGNVINAVLGIVGSLALVMFIYGGITWMTASGNEKGITKGKDILVWAALGLVVIFFSYALTKFVISAIGA